MIHDSKLWIRAATGRMCRTGLFICLLLPAMHEHAAAQGISVIAAADKSSILIGEPIRLQLEARMPEGTDAKWFVFDSIPHFDYISKAKIDTMQQDNMMVLKQTVTVTSFDSGRWVIPSMEVEVNGRSYVTDSFPVAVAFSDFDPSKDYHDIKDILEVAAPYTGYITWAIAAAALLSLLAVFYFLRRRTAAKAPPVRMPAGTLTAFEEAMQSLDKLRQQQLPEKGEVKTYYTRLNDILRVFLLRQLALATLQKTNDELMVQVAHTRLPHHQVIALAQALRMSDAVKFARYIPGAADNNHNFDIVRTSVEQINNLPQSVIQLVPAN